MIKNIPIALVDYLSNFPIEIQERLLAIRSLVLENVPHATEVIRYGMPAFHLGKEHVYVAAYKKHIGFYPVYGLDDLEEDLVKYRGKNTKDALHFPHNKELPLDLISKIVIAKSLRT